LDRMALMLIFVSTDALKSGWTYFEAGYGLHKLGSANIYCLPGTDKAALPSPFNILQNRNLHSAREVGLLVRQINERLDGRMSENVTKQDFDRVFRKPSLGQIDTTPRLAELVESIIVTTVGPHNSYDIFSETCKELGYPVSTATATYSGHRDWCSTGVRISVEEPDLDRLEKEIEINEKMRQAGVVEITEIGSKWRSPDILDFDRTIRRPVAEIDDYNVEVRTRNDDIRRRNDEKKVQPRGCSFTLVPIDIAAPTMIVDGWLAETTIPPPLDIEIKLLSEVACESRGEAIGVKIHGSQLSLLRDGTLLWIERAVVALEPSRLVNPTTLRLKAREGLTLKLSDFQIEDLLSTLCELNILSLPVRHHGRRRR